ncbi:MAG TPA: hypothetical protein VMG30_10945 [Acidobacteriota bacterium]|nr:hypothetical protein [Acidobacteriota bacterium]
MDEFQRERIRDLIIRNNPDALNMIYDVMGNRPKSLEPVRSGTVGRQISNFLGCHWMAGNRGHRAFYA